MRLDIGAAERAIASSLAKPLAVSVMGAAWTIHDVVNEAMASAVRMHVSERGGDPSRSVLIAFGGAGPVHVANLAAKLGIQRILVPLRAGVLSALGLVTAPAAFDIARTRKTPLHALEFAKLAGEVAAIQAEIRARLEEVDAAAPRFSVALGLGYVGQSYHVPVPVDADRITELTRDGLLTKFGEVYRAKYGYFYDDVPVELVTVHVSGSAGRELERLPDGAAAGADPTDALTGERLAWSSRKRDLVPFKIYRRDRLGPGMQLKGPCLVEEDTATTVVDTDTRIKVDRFWSLDIALPSSDDRTES